MAITALVNNGIIDTVGSEVTKAQESKQTSDTNGVDEDMFLQLLVAEMKYQDPMEPSSNTEWVSQYATFTQVQQQGAMQDSIQQSQASGLVGKQVIMKNSDDDGNANNYVHGTVDFVNIKNDGVYLSVNGQTFNIDQLDSVVDDTYLNNAQLASDFETLMSQLPSVEQVSLEDKDSIAQVRSIYDAMNTTQQGMISTKSLATLTTLEDKVEALAVVEAGEADA